MLDLLQHVVKNDVFLGVGGATILGALMYVLRSFPRLLWQKFVALFTVSFEVKSDNTAFHWMLLWLAEQPYNARARVLRLAAVSKSNDEVAVDDYGNAPGREMGYMLSPGYGMHFFWCAGNLVTIWRSKDEKEAKYGSPETITLRVFGRKREFINDIIRAAYDLAHKDARERLNIYMSSGHGWYVGIRQPKRTLDTVILAEDLTELLLNDMLAFRERREWYMTRGVPWRRGYLFEGPPGCGKTSIVGALASALNVGVCSLDLGSMLGGSDLMNALRSQPEDSLLLIEDVDAAFKDRDAKEAKVSFSQFLNAIDGLTAPNGRMLVMTSNHADKLDPALIRPGRVDVRKHFGLATAEQASRMFLRFFPESSLAVQFGVMANGLSPAEIQRVLMLYSTDADAAYAHVKKHAIRAA